MNNMYNIVEELCVEKGVNVTQMCREAGIPRATMTELKMGRTEKLSTMNLEKLATYFGMSIDDLLNGQKEKLTPNKGSERNYGDSVLMDAFKQADASTQEAILLLLKLK